MTFRWLVSLLAGPALACVTVDGPDILGRHLASADPSFRAIAADTIIAQAPIPGVKRNFMPAELAGIAKRYNVQSGGFKDALCFEWPMAVIEPSAILGAMHRSLELPSAVIEILEADHHPAPAGEIEFPRAGIGTAGKNGLFWRGYVKYASGRKYSTWARVRISAVATQVIASAPLEAGQPIRAEQVHVEAFNGLSFQNPSASSLEEVVGKSPRRHIRAGDPIWRSVLAMPLDIALGENVEVTVLSGSIRFRTEGKAKHDGRRGDTILVRNESSGKDFWARVEGPGRVSVLAARGSK